MAHHRYQDYDGSPESLELIDHVNSVIDDFESQGFVMTLRQIYYQLVGRGLIENDDKVYARLGRVVGRGRLAGLIDWAMIEDRTRFVREHPHWSSPSEIIEAASNSYRRPRWADQPYAPEVWVEKDALIGVVEQVARELDVPCFSCRGYMSLTALHESGQRMRDYLDHDRVPVILHLGDHDPSGIQMTADITKRLAMFAGEEIEVHRLGLNLDQVRRYRPPPNTAKLTDSRSAAYIDEYGPAIRQYCAELMVEAGRISKASDLPSPDEGEIDPYMALSWELDALAPSVITELVRAAVLALRDDDLYAEEIRIEEAERELLLELSEST